MIRLLVSFLAVALVALPVEAASDALGWKLQREGKTADSSYRIWARSVVDSSYPEYRMEIELRASVDEVMGALESNMLDARTWPRSFRRTVLRREHDLLLSYDYIAVPLLSDRDVVLRTQIQREPGSGGFRMDWETVLHAGPPPRSGVVRIPRSEGFWRVEGDGQGGSRAVYQSFVELTGRMPSALVHSKLQSSTLHQAQWLNRTVKERRLALLD